MKNDDPYLTLVKRTRPREPMPRPVVFKDKTKYDRNRSKKELREEVEEDGVFDSQTDDATPQHQ